MIGNRLHNSKYFKTIYEYIDYVKRALMLRVYERTMCLADALLRAVFAAYILNSSPISSSNSIFLSLFLALASMQGGYCI